MKQQLDSNGQTPISEPSSQAPNAQQNGKSWTSEYYEAVKAGLMRVWLNRYLWFWGIFLPAGFGVNANYNFNSQEFSGNEDIDRAAQNFFTDVGNFVSEYLVLILAGILLLLVIMVVFWMLSAVARSGVIQALNALQDPKEGATYTFKTVWQKGKQRFLSIMMIDVIVGFSMTLIMIILATPIVLLVIQQRYGGAVLLGLLAFLIFIPLVLLSTFLKQSGAIVTVLSKSSAIKSIEIAYTYVKGNIKEALKLLLTLVVLGIVQGLAAFAAIFPVVVIVIGVGLFFVGFSGVAGFADPNNRVALIVVISLVAILVLAMVLLLKSIFSLWIQDLWLWWTKKVGSVITAVEDEDAVEVKETVKRKALSGAEES